MINAIGIIILILLLLGVFLWFQIDDSIKAQSTIDGNYYIIRHGRNKSKKYLEDSANQLAVINSRIEKLIYHLDKKYGSTHEYDHCLEILRKRYNHNVLSEAAIDKRYTTYTLNKRDMHICLRTRDNHEQLYDTNTLMYVVIHELAHLCNYTRDNQPIVGHGIEFMEIFRLLLKNAIAIGIYEYIDYRKTPKEYCGMLIWSNII
jgi:hypothetical protein